MEERVCSRADSSVRQRKAQTELEHAVCDAKLPRQLRGAETAEGLACSCAAIAAAVRAAGLAGETAAGWESDLAMGRLPMAAFTMACNHPLSPEILQAGKAEDM